MNKPVQNKEELLRIITSCKRQICEYGVQKLGIFGSFVKGKIRPESDVDFFVEIQLEQKTLRNFMALHRYLQNLTGRRVEVVTPQSLNKFIGKYILSEIEYVPLFT